MNNAKLYHLWRNQENIDVSGGQLKNLLKTNLHAYYNDLVMNMINNCSKDTLYKHIKTDLTIEKYLSVLPVKLRTHLCKFRLSNHKLPIEKGRAIGIPRDERTCTKCELNDIGDEFHYVLICPFFKEIRMKLLPPYYYTRPSMFKLCQLFTVKGAKKLCRTAKLCEVINNNM